MIKRRFKKLEKMLSSLDVPSEVPFRSELKNKLMVRVEEEMKFVNDLKTEAGGLRLDVGIKARIKNSILEKIEEMPVSGKFGFLRPVYLAACGALATFMVVYVGMLNTVLFQYQTAMATVLTDVQGDVFVVRGGKMFTAYENMPLLEKDIVSTGDESSASIKYLDDSVSRLDEGSSVALNRLFAHPKKKTFTVVEVEVIEGEVWNKVVNLVDDNSSQFKVKADQVAASASDKAAFNVKKDVSGEVKVKVIENTVDVAEKKVSQGQEAVVKKVYNKDLVEIKDRNVESEEDAKWIADNLEKDENYVKEVVEAKKEERKKVVGVLPDSPLYSIKQIKTDTALLLTDDEVEKKKLQFGVAHRRLKEAQVLLDNGDVDGAQPILDEFKVEAEDYSKYIAELRNENPELAMDLQIELQDVIDANMKELAPVSDGEPLEKAKDVLREVGDLVAENNILVEAGEGSEVVDANGTGKAGDVGNVGKAEVAGADGGKNVKGINLKLPLVPHFVGDGNSVSNKYEEETIKPQVFTSGGLEVTGLEDEDKGLETVVPEIYNPEGVKLFGGPEEFGNENDGEALADHTEDES